MSNNAEEVELELDPIAEEPKLSPQEQEEKRKEIEEYTQRTEKKAWDQFDKARDQARAIYDEVSGYAGVRSTEEWDAMLEEAHTDIGSGRFITRCLGAERYIKGEIIAALVCFRQDLIAGQSKISAKKMMIIDAAIFHYFNMIRVQGWIGNLCLNFEGEAFGQKFEYNAILAETVRRMEEDAKRLNDVCLPAQDKASRSLMRCLSALE